MNFSESAPVFCGSACASAPCYSRAEDVPIISVVVPEFKFSDVQRQIFAADLVEDNAHQLTEFRISETGTNAVAHIVRGCVAAKTHHAVNLESGDTFLAGQHQIDDLEPLPHWLVGVFEDRANQDGEPIAALIAALALPVERAGLQLIDLRAAATRAMNAVRPTTIGQILLASVVSRKQFFELSD